MTRKINYRFDFEDNSHWQYDIEFDQKNNFVSSTPLKIKEWTKLENFKCPNCPLSSSNHQQCPVARNLDQIVEDSKDTVSCLRAKVTVTTPERTYFKECATQEGLLALFGVIMASSGCPHLDWLRPLSRFHLPFASLEENLFRTLSVQLLHQFFDSHEGSIEDCSENIQALYSEVQTVNHSFIERIRSYCQGDADKNAIAALDVFVQIFHYHKDSNFSAIKNLFQP